jgi:ABC-type dipeptide/oligopeptide/nickel transport system permease subunit
MSSRHGAGDDRDRGEAPFIATSSPSAQVADAVLTTFSGLAVMLAVLAFNLVGDALRDLLDPRLRGG